ncbi:hypothetical protein HCDG_04607 [Histoplasma capsulatum H143]|uniref:Uncharacterized protein n=1 Tax=Ajellomyces capsulatus (strain H143) TaxID=544712 RepID=C6HF84_AJECH|nr:hypothetical protein HCDG_04607 [Histoplasma capsulatum H143]
MQEGGCIYNFLCPDIEILENLANGLNQAAAGIQRANSELQKLPNLPAIAQGSAIVNQLQQIQHQIQENYDQLRQEIRQVRKDVIIGFQTIEYNSIARLQNSGIKRADYPLTTLRDYKTNTNIADFPATPAEISNMTGTTLNRVLEALNLPTTGTTDCGQETTTSVLCWAA